MKHATKFCAILAIAFGAHLLYAHNNEIPVADTPEEECYLEDNHATSGMFFTSRSVVEEYEYDDAYCLLYDDADANMFNVEICVDLETFQMVKAANAENREIVGILVLNEDLSFDGLEVFTYMPDPEFEMAYASAQI